MSLWTYLTVLNMLLGWCKTQVMPGHKVVVCTFYNILKTGPVLGKICITGRFVLPLFALFGFFHLTFCSSVPLPQDPQLHNTSLFPDNVTI